MFSVGENDKCSDEGNEACAYNSGANCDCLVLGWFGVHGVFLLMRLVVKRERIVGKLELIVRPGLRYNKQGKPLDCITFVQSPSGYCRAWNTVSRQ